MEIALLVHSCANPSYMIKGLIMKTKSPCHWYGRGFFSKLI